MSRIDYAGDGDWSPVLGCTRCDHSEEDGDAWGGGDASLANATTFQRLYAGGGGAGTLATFNDYGSLAADMTRRQFGPTESSPAVATARGLEVAKAMLADHWRMSLADPAFYRELSASSAAVKTIMAQRDVQQYLIEAVVMSRAMPRPAGGIAGAMAGRLLPDPVTQIVNPATTPDQRWRLFADLLVSGGLDAGWLTDFAEGLWEVVLAPLAATNPPTLPLVPCRLVRRIADRPRGGVRESVALHFL
jgi:hypothetical protein